MHAHKVVAQYVNALLRFASADVMRAKTGGEMEKFAMAKPASVIPG